MYNGVRRTQGKASTVEEYPGTATTSVETIGRQGASADDAGCTRTILEEPLEIEPVEGAVA